MSAGEQPRTVLEQLIAEEFTWPEAAARFNLLAEEIARGPGGYRMTSLSERQLRRIAAGEVPRPYRATVRVLERQFGRPIQELLRAPACGVGDGRDADWSRPSALLGVRADQRVLLPDTSGEEDDVDRRAFGGVLAVGGAFLGAESIRRGLGVTLGLPSTGDTVEEWERTVHEYAGLTSKAGLRSSLLPRLIADLDEVRTHIETANEGLRPRLADVAARLSGLAAIALSSGGHWSDATAYWRTARQASSASADHGGLSCLLGGRRAILNIYGPVSQNSALGIANEVLARAGGKPSSGAANALAARAQILALEGDRAGAYSALSDLERLFDGLDDTVRSDRSTWGWPEHKLHNARSFVYSYTGNTRAATAAQGDALAFSVSPYSEATIQIKCHQAACMIVSGDVVQGARHVGEVFQSIPPSLRNGHMRSSVSFALDKLPERAARLPAVREVRALVTSSA
ncbi:hypothetical protein [Pseudonocardia acaciae]|uniref:hypothetical protein n=1 Tax=Pseudonocardia acaciae TaxID=551276 RepID=UPI00048B8393|nr:hypothetical protein [Pseudonocardia acaciae]